MAGNSNYPTVPSNPLYEATRSPDKFPAEYQDAQDHSRVTPSSMGGEQVPQWVHPMSRRLDEQARALAGIQRHLQNREERTLQFGAGGLSAVGTSNPNVIAFGELCPLGFTWQVKAVIVGPSDFTALPYATNVTTIVAARSPQARAAAGAAQLVGASDVLGISTAWPAEITWGREQANALGGEQVQVIVVGLAAGVGISASLQVVQTADDVPVIRSN